MPDHKCHRFGLADFTRQLAVADRLASLSAKSLQLPLDLGKHVLKTVEVLLGCPQPQLRLMSPAEQPMNAGGLLQDAAPRFRFGRNQRSHPALADDGRRMGADRRVGKQELDVTGSYLATVDPIG